MAKYGVPISERAETIALAMLDLQARFDTADAAWRKADEALAVARETREKAEKALDEQRIAYAAEFGITRWHGAQAEERASDRRLQEAVGS